jgi:hypothetical protein
MQLFLPFMGPNHRGLGDTYMQWTNGNLWHKRENPLFTADYSESNYKQELKATGEDWSSSMIGRRPSK